MPSSTSYEVASVSKHLTGTHEASLVPGFSTISSGNTVSPCKGSTPPPAVLISHAERCSCMPWSRSKCTIRLPKITGSAPESTKTNSGVKPLIVTCACRLSTIAARTRDACLSSGGTTGNPCKAACNDAVVTVVDPSTETWKAAELGAPCNMPRDLLRVATKGSVTSSCKIASNPASPARLMADCDSKSPCRACSKAAATWACVIPTPSQENTGLFMSRSTKLKGVHANCCC